MVLAALALLRSALRQFLNSSWTAAFVCAREKSSHKDTMRPAAALALALTTTAAAFVVAPQRASPAMARRATDEPGDDEQRPAKISMEGLRLGGGQTALVPSSGRAEHLSEILTNNESGLTSGRVRAGLRDLVALGIGAPNLGTFKGARRCAKISRVASFSERSGRRGGRAGEAPCRWPARSGSRRLATTPRRRRGPSAD